MSYIVLARKWRPQTFSDIVGQTAIAKTLSNSIRLDRIGHAFLFSGPRGIGKTSTARILSKALNCENGPSAEPCNDCRCCQEITDGISLDVLEIDGASNRGIDEIRELRENIKYSPASSRFKIIIIDEVHMLTREAFNALLKTLEEPPPHVKFILATTEAHKIPVTILSRCQCYDFKRISFNDIKETLSNICKKEKIKIQSATLEVLARVSDGSLRDGLSLLDQVISFSGNLVNHKETMRLLGRVDPAIIRDVFTALAKGEGKTALKRFGDYIESGGDELVFNRDLMETTRDIMSIKVGGTSDLDIPSKFIKAFSIDQLERYFKLLLELEISLRNSDHPRLIMDVALVRMSRIQSLTPLEDILAMLEQLHGQNKSPNKQNTKQKLKPASNSTNQQDNAASTTKPDSSSGNQVIHRIIKNLADNEGAIKAYLEHGAVIEVEETKLTIGFKSDNQFYLERLKLPAIVKQIEAAAKIVFDREIEVCFTLDNTTVPSLAEETGNRKKKEDNNKLKLAMENKSISEIVNTFNARLRDVQLQPLEENSSKETNQ